MAAKVKSGVNAGGEHFIREPVALEARTVGEAGAYAKPWTPALAESRVALAESLGMVRSGPTGMRGTNSTGGGGNVGKDSHKKQKSFDAQVKKFVDAVKVGDVTCVRQMLNADANLCHATIDSSMAFSPLHWASAKNHAEVCLILLEAKANVNCSNRNGVTALHSAALNGSHAVVEVLLEYGADINATDVNGKTAEACARSKKNNCVDLFDIKAIVQEMTNSPGAWTMKKMAELLKLCNQIAPSTCTRHELEERVRTVQPALAHVWQDVLLYRKKFMKASFSFWLSNIRHAKWLARTSIYVQSLCRHKLVLRTFRYWRVLEREVCSPLPALYLCCCREVWLTCWLSGMVSISMALGNAALLHRMRSRRPRRTGRCNASVWRMHWQHGRASATTNGNKKHCIGRSDA